MNFVVFYYLLATALALFTLNRLLEPRSFVGAAAVLIIGFGLGWIFWWWFAVALYERQVGLTRRRGDDLDDWGV